MGNHQGYDITVWTLVPGCLHTPTNDDGHPGRGVPTFMLQRLTCFRWKCRSPWLGRSQGHGWRRRWVFLLRCPIKSSGLRWSSILSTAATRSAPFIRHRRRSHRSPSWMIGLPDTPMSSKGQKNFVFFCDFYAFLPVKGRFLHTLTAALNLT